MKGMSIFWGRQRSQNENSLAIHEWKACNTIYYTERKGLDENFYHTAAMTPEAKVKKNVKEVLDSYAGSVWYFMPVGGMFGRSGVPDFIACVEGQFVAIETKAGKNKPTALQELAMSKLRLAGGMTVVINETNINDLHELIHEICLFQRDGGLE